MSIFNAIIKKIFPVSANKSQQYFLEIEKQVLICNNLLKRSLDKIEMIEDEQNQLKRTLEKNNADFIKLTESMDKISNDNQMIFSKMQTNEKENSEKYVKLLADIEIIHKGVTESNMRYHSFLYENKQTLQVQKSIRGMIQQRDMVEESTVNQYYLFEYIKRMLKLFPIKKIIDDQEHDFIRMGRNNDGGYVMYNDFSSANIAYSFGISDDVSWDKDMANLGLDVYMYDHTIESLPEFNDKFHYHKIGLTSLYSSDEDNLKTLPMLLYENGHCNEKNMVLKIDIEGAEWDVLNELDENILMQFEQIVMELHDLTHFKKEDQFKNALYKINRTHELVHVHANNYGDFIQFNGRILPELLEVTYVRKGKYKFKESKCFYPTSIDQANDLSSPEIILGEFYKL